MAGQQTARMRSEPAIRTADHQRRRITALPVGLVQPSGDPLAVVTRGHPVAEVPDELRLLHHPAIHLSDDTNR